MHKLQLRTHVVTLADHTTQNQQNYGQDKLRQSDIMSMSKGKKESDKQTEGTSMGKDKTESDRLKDPLNLADLKDSSVLRLLNTEINATNSADV